MRQNAQGIPDLNAKGRPVQDHLAAIARRDLEERFDARLGDVVTAVGSEQIDASLRCDGVRGDPLAELEGEEGQDFMKGCGV